MDSTSKNNKILTNLISFQSNIIGYKGKTKKIKYERSVHDEEP